jgi:hypothetical protein
MPRACGASSNPGLTIDTRDRGYWVPAFAGTTAEALANAPLSLFFEGAGTPPSLFPFAPKREWSAPDLGFTRDRTCLVRKSGKPDLRWRPEACEASLSRACDRAARAPCEGARVPCDRDAAPPGAPSSGAIVGHRASLVSKMPSRRLLASEQSAPMIRTRMVSGDKFSIGLYSRVARRAQRVATLPLS